MKALKVTGTLVFALLMSACSGGSTTYSLLSEGQSFHQNSAFQMTKIDVMWVIDNSGSMASSQSNLANNFPTFINNFTSKNYDFQMAVTTTDAYLALSQWTPYYNQSPTPSYYHGLPQEQIAWWRNGTTGHPSGYEIINMLTPNISNVFSQNALQGTAGHGDERSFQSMKTALTSTHNAGFVRPGGFLAVIMLTDEDDFSHDGTGATTTYSSALHSVDSYVQFLDGFTSSSAAARRYSVNTISVDSQACLDSIYNGAQKIGVRVRQLADATGGIKGSICGNFANELDIIAKSIVELSTQFYLNGDPVPESIRVYVDNSEIPNASTTSGNGGWTYNASANSIVFSGNYVPPQNAAINVTFDPKTINF
jgi:hypothetical protein